MKITLGGKKISANTLIEEGKCKATFELVREGREDEKAKIGSELLETAVFEIKVYHKGGTQKKEKKIILTDRKESELSALLEEFSYLADVDGSIDLMDLVGEECEVEIVHNESQRGNIFANIGEITSIVKEDLEIEDLGEEGKEEEEESIYE